jgi:hypothetical protein
MLSDNASRGLIGDRRRGAKALRQAFLKADERDAEG